MLASSPKLQLEPTDRGGLRIWEMPRPGLRYVVGSDTAHGLAKGDFAASAVIEADTCTLVATWREKCDPHVWGCKTAWLAWLYNEAILAFETFPSASGITASEAAMRAGYKHMYRRTLRGRVQRKSTDLLGWRTQSDTKPMMIDRVKVALESQTSFIFDEDLLQELRTRSWDANGKMTGPGHDDLFAAYSIALMVRDESWRAGKLRKDPAPEDHSASARYWKSQMDEWAKLKKPGRRGLRPGPGWKGLRKKR